MIGTRTILHRSAPRLASAAFHRQQSAFIFARALGVHVSPATNALRTASKRQESPSVIPVIRPFSSASVATATSLTPPIQGVVSDGVSSKEEKIQKSPGSVTKTLRVLNMDVVKNILDELRSVDVNFDGRLDAGELKQLLRKHNNAFTDEEINEIGELFYAGKSGGSVSFERFVEAIDKIVHMERSDDAEKEALGNPLNLGTCGAEYLYYKSHGNYKPDDIRNVQFTHTEPQNLRDRFALACVKGVRFLFDKATGWDYGRINRDMVLNRTIYLETIAAVPGMVAAIVRHFRSLRQMERDGGKIQMFLEEAENERMHLLTFVRMKNPGRLFRAAVIAGQFGFGSLFGLSYIISPKFCHRFVGYIEEEAVTTYTKIIHAIEQAPDNTDLGKWKTELAPRIARSYWHLGENGSVLDLMLAVRADEAEHRDVNHLCSELDEKTPNPVNNTEQKLNTMLLRYVQDMMEKDADKPVKMTAHS